MPSLIERILKKVALHACLFTAAGCASGTATGARSGAPPRPQPCPEAALVAMKALNVTPGRQAHIYIDISDPGFATERAIHREGPIVSIYDADDGFALLPNRSRLYGYMWMGEEEFHLHWDRIRLPDGRMLPFCAVAGGDTDGGHWYDPSPEPGTFMTAKQIVMTVTDHFIKPR